MTERYRPETEPRFDPVGGPERLGAPIYGDVRASLDQNADAFGRLVALNIQNQADLASHYPYSPERFRLFVNGTRQFIQYDGEPASYEDTVDSHLLKPQSDGDVVSFETTEIFRYAVQYVIEWSAALQTNQALQTGDVLTFGYGDADLNNLPGTDTLGPSADGYFWIFTPDLDIDEVVVAQYRNGTEQFSKTVTRENDLTDWTRLATETNWYSIGESRFFESFTRDGKQRNIELDTTSNDKGKGPELGNHPIQIAIKSGSASAGSLEVEVGSVGLRTLGDVAPILRRKTLQTTQTVGSSGTWVPVYALRIDPDRDIVNAQLTDIRVPKFTGNGDVRVMGMAFDPSKLRDSGGNAIVDADFSTPAEHSSRNSVVEESTAVAQFPNSGGTIVTSTTNPGGYQEGYGANYTTTGNANKQAVSQQTKRSLPHEDIVVFLARATATGDVTLEIVTEQQW